MFAIVPPEVRTPKLSGALRRRRSARVAHEVAEPADHLLLDEGAGRAAGPDVDPLVRPLGEHLAGDRHRERRRGEVAEGAGVVGVQEVGREALAELGEDLGRGGRVRPGRGQGGRRSGRRSCSRSPG